MARGFIQMRTQLDGLVDKMLFDYPHIDKYVENRREELQYPYTETDENVGGSKSTKISKPIENLIITIDEDKTLHGLLEQKNAIYKACQSLKEEHYKIIERYYFYNQAKFKTLGALLMDYNVPERTFYRALAAFKHDIISNLELNFLEWQRDK